MRELGNERMRELENQEMREWGASYKKRQRKGLTLPKMRAARAV